MDMAALSLFFSHHLMYKLQQLGMESKDKIQTKRGA
jgi:hypothetical protein